MIAAYVDAVLHAMAGVRDLFLAAALPIAVCLGLALVAGALILALQRDAPWLQQWDWRRKGVRAAGYAAAGLLALAAWAALGTPLPLAREDIAWREAAEATANPVPDAQPVFQYGPALAALAEHTYTRTLTLPPDFLQRIGAEGVGVLAPYLTDPTAENVLRLVDTFRRSGKDVVFTREMTRLDEEPIPFADSRVSAKFRRLGGRAYDADFEGHYVIRNPRDAAITARFLFPLPQAGTVRDLNVSVGGQAIVEPGRSGAYEWSAALAPGEMREAVVRYRVLGARTWAYDMGSQRRRVERFRLDAQPGGPVRFLRGSLQPTSRPGNALQWELANVVTAQQVTLAFLPETAARESYLQSLSALPAAFVLFLVGVLALGLWRGRLPGPGGIVAGIALFTLGLAAAPVLAAYAGPVAALIVLPPAGAAAASWPLGRLSLVAAVPAALLPAAFLSPQQSGILVLALAVLALAAVGLVARRSHRRTEPAGAP